MSDIVEHGHKMKRIHEQGGSTNSPESGQEAPGGKNSAAGAHPMPSGRESISLF